MTPENRRVLTEKLAMIKAKELREMSDEQLAVTLKETTDNFFRLRLQAQTERLDAPSELRKSRRLVAAKSIVQTTRHPAGKTTASSQPAFPSRRPSLSR